MPTVGRGLLREVTTPQTTVPPSVSQASVEDITWGIDCSAQLSDSQTVTAVTVTLTNGAGQTMTLADTPTISGNVIEQRVRAGVLAPASIPPSGTLTGQYTLTATFTPSSTTNVLANQLVIICPF